MDNEKNVDYEWIPLCEGYKGVYSLRHTHLAYNE
jgi:hypothetical protein